MALFTPRELEALSTSAWRVVYKRKKIIFQASDPSDSVYLLVSGMVRIFRTTPEGKELSLNYIKGEELFGENALVERGPRGAGAQALHDSTILGWKVTEFELAMESDPVLAKKVLRHISSRLKELEENVEVLIYKEVAQKLARLLIRIARDYGVSDSRGVIIPLKISHKCIASFLGASRETVSQTLSSFEREKLIARDNRRIIIPNGDRLEALL